MSTTVPTKTILIISQSHLSRNPRVLKEAKALFAAGFHVSVLTAIYDNRLYLEDLNLLTGTTIEYRVYSDLRKANFGSFKARLLRKFWIFAQSKLHIENKRSLGYHPGELRKELARAKADLFIMHQELATVEGAFMAQRQKVAFDIEDWYSEDLSPQARSTRPISLLKAAEKKAITDGALCYTTSKAMAHGLRAHYKTQKEPLVIYNCFDAATPIRRSPDHSPYIRLYWFSQTIGPGRGLEFFIDCIAKNTSRWELNLRGQVSATYQSELSNKLSSKDRINFLPMIGNDEILDDMQNYDYGLALEPDTPLNKDLTISNKLFHYLAGGLPVIASNTKGQAEIADQCPGIVLLYSQRSQHELSGLLEKISKSYTDQNKEERREKIFALYNSRFAWQKESNKLVEIVRNAFGQID